MIINIKKFDIKSSFNSLVNNKFNFLISVYFTIIFQILITYYVLYLCNIYDTILKDSSKYLIFYFIISFILMFIINFFNIPYWLNIILLIMYASTYGFLLHHFSFFVPKDIINNYLIGMICIFILLIIFIYIIFYFNIKINWFGLIISGFIIGLISDIIVNFFTIKNKKDLDYNHVKYLYIVIIMFSIYFTYSTNVMLRINYSQNDASIKACTELYFGFLNTILYIVQIIKNNF